jgi:hypothetical protein
LAVIVVCDRIFGDVMNRHQAGRPTSRSRGFRPATTLLCLTSFSCYGYASIERRSGSTLEAQIDRSDSENLYVTPEDGPQQAVNRADVLDISHPGKVRIATGTTIAAVGASMLIYGLLYPSCRGTRTPQEDCGWDFGKLMWTQLGVFGLVAGSPLAASGWFAYENSVTAAKAYPVIRNWEAMQRSLPRFRRLVWPRWSPAFSLELRTLSNSRP